MLRVILGVALFFIFLGGLIVWMAGGVQSPRTFDSPVRVVGNAPADLVASRTATITVVVWNIAWGYGWGSEGNGLAKPASHFEGSIKKLGAQLAALGADIALIQEIDFGSDRSGNFDQAQVIAEIAKLPFVAAAPSWSANYIPFPYWPPKEHFGRMRSGGAILSRFPIEINTVQLLEKPSEYPFYYNLFYLFRYLQHAQIRIGTETVQVYNTHLEAFKEKNRVEQARMVEKILARDGAGSAMFGGDFNAVPAEATQKSNYADEQAPKMTVTGHETDDTVKIIRGIEHLVDAFPAEKYSAAEKEYFTFPSHAPNRKLDHFFFGDHFELIEARVAQEVGNTSDHLPLVIKLRFKPLARG